MDSTTPSFDWETHRNSNPRATLSPFTLSDSVLLQIIDEYLTISRNGNFKFIPLLVVSKRVYRLALPRIFRELSSQELSSYGCHRAANLLDPEFDQRLAESCNRLFGNTQSSTAPIDTRGSRFPLTPANFHPSIQGPCFRRHIVAFRLSSRWDVSVGLKPAWLGKGFPFASVPLLLDVVRLRLPALRSLWVDLPKSIITHESQREQIEVIASDIVSAICKFGLLERLTLDQWELPGEFCIPRRF
jgi:hypothetical protein